MKQFAATEALGGFPNPRPLPTRPPHPRCARPCAMVRAERSFGSSPRGSLPVCSRLGERLRAEKFRLEQEPRRHQHANANQRDVFRRQRRRYRRDAGQRRKDRHRWRNLHTVVVTVTTTTSQTAIGTVTNTGSITAVVTTTRTSTNASGTVSITATAIGTTTQTSTAIGTGTNTISGTSTSTLGPPPTYLPPTYTTGPIPAGSTPVLVDATGKWHTATRSQDRSIHIRRSQWLCPSSAWRVHDRHGVGHAGRCFGRRLLDVRSEGQRNRTADHRKRGDRSRPDLEPGHHSRSDLRLGVGDAVHGPRLERQ